MALPFAAIGLGISAISSGVNLISGLSRKSKAKKQLANFQRQELRNVTEGMRVSTLGAELQTQEAQRRFSTSVDALRSGGVRGLVGGLGRQEQVQQVQQQRVAADLDRQQVGIEQMRAQDEGRIRSMQERRETAAIAGLGREISEGRNQALAGAAGLAGSAFAGYELDKAGAFDNGLFGSPGSSKSPQGLTSNVVDLATGGQATQGLIDSQPTRFLQGPDGVSDVSKAFSFTRDIGAALLSTETPSLAQTYVNTGEQYGYGLKPR